MYTCRGGFIDTAHVRDYLDWGAYLSATISKAILSGEVTVIPLPDEGGKRRVLEIEPAIASQDPFPDLPTVVTDSDLARIVETIRAQNRVEFGPGSDRPD